MYSVAVGSAECAGTYSAIMERVLVVTDEPGRCMEVLDPFSGSVLFSYEADDSLTESSAVLPICSYRGGPAYVAVCHHKKAMLLIYSREKVRPVKFLALPERLSTMCLSPNGTFLLGGGCSGGIYVWHLGTSNLVRNWQGSPSPVTAAIWTATQIILGWAEGVISVHLDASVVAGESPEPPHLARWSLPNLVGVGVVGHSENPTVVAASDSTVHLFRAPNRNPIATKELHAPITCLTVGVEGIDVFVGLSDFQILRLPVAVHETDRQEFSGHSPVVTGSGQGGQGVNCLCVTDSGSLLISSSDDGLRIWDVMSAQTIRHISLKSRRVIKVIPFLDIMGTGNPSGGQQGRLAVEPLPPIAHLKAQTRDARDITTVCAISIGRRSALSQEIRRGITSQWSSRHALDLIGEIQQEISTAASSHANDTRVQVLSHRAQLLSDLSKSLLTNAKAQPQAPEPKQQTNLTELMQQALKLGAGTDAASVVAEKRDPWCKVEAMSRSG